MNENPMKYTALFAASLLPFMTCADTKESLSIGAGFVLQNSAYADYDDDNRVIPLVKFENEHFFVDKDGAGYKLFENQQHRVGIAIGIGKEEWDPKNTNRFRTLDTRHRSIDAGVSYRFQDRIYGQFSAKLSTDISDDHNGIRADLGYGYPYPVTPELMLIPNIHLSYMDSDYANYYYGVSEEESARSGVSAYDTGSALKYGVGLAAAYRITEEWSVSAGANYSWLDSELEDSPLVDDDAESSVFMGVSYKFW
ncbi:MipA/OmpV family protein [Corallincola luteus]|uniref:MipA/OmpV family protein n=2 Tax=Corallincola luteus TaxID=1775177 RepID=A0ABY2ALC9_9GAMM|nr:MipA/OmpV family protein [Corallincola luteus]